MRDRRRELGNNSTRQATSRNLKGKGTVVERKGSDGGGLLKGRKNKKKREEKINTNQEMRKI